MNYFWNAVSSHGSSFDLVWFLAASTLKATVLLGFVALLCLLVRRFSAATRHLLWTLSLCAALLLPFLSVVEVWEVPILPAEISSWSPAQSNELTKTSDEAFQLPEEAIQRSEAVAAKRNESKLIIPDVQPTINSVEKSVPVTNPSEISTPLQQRSATVLPALMNWALAVWFAGALLFFFRLLVGLMSSKWLTGGAVEFKDEKLNGLFSSLLIELQLKGKVRLLKSERTLMPIVCGVFRPVVLLPASADEWSDERKKMVLLHELTHVARRDCLTQLLAQTACAFYWFNPFVWHAARRLRVEREQACDDYVLRIGTKPSDYAHHLLDIARYLQERSVFQWSQSSTVAMARQSQLEGRLLAILSKEEKSRAASQVMIAGVTASVLLLFLLLAIVRPTLSSAKDSGLPENASHAEKGAAEKSSFGSFLTKVSGLKDEASIKDAGLQETVETQADNAVDNSQETISNGAQVSHDDEKDLEIEAAQDDKSEAAEVAPPQPPDFPAPVVKVEPGIAVVPYINLKLQHQPKAEPQDKTDFIDEMASVGYTNLSIKELVNLKATGVTAEYVRSLRAIGLNNLTAKDVAGMSANGVTRAFIESIRNAGYKDLAAKELTTYRIHGITPEFINRLRNAGYGNLSSRDLIQFAVHQVTVEFINSMRSAGFVNLLPKELVSLRVHAITPAFVRDARKRLGDLTIKQIITLKIEGLMDAAGDN